jgi:SEC-C motif-containing protein
MPSVQATSPCPCGRLGPGREPASHAQCCGRYIDDFAHQPAPDAESLMRSRYSAFVREAGDYLLASWHAPERPPTLDFTPGAKWLGLAVMGQRQTGPDQAEVEFVARQREPGGRAVRLHERSRFVREGGRWFYVDGDILPG